MTRYVALLRAVNVGGTGRLAMADLAALSRDAGLTNVRTYIASGNVVFDSTAKAPGVVRAIEERLLAHLGKPTAVLLRTAAEMAAVLAANPFPDAAAKLTSAFFLAGPPPADALAGIAGRKDEVVRLGGREIYVHYPSGMGRSKLRIPAAEAGTARNMNTVAKLAAMAAAP